MPKVSNEYLTQKKNLIIDGALNVCRTKPLYQITMKDVIREIGISQGGIYRYFSDVDEILVAVINRCNPNADYRKNIDFIIGNSKTSKDAVESLFTFLGNYMQDNAGTVGKFLFELTVIMAHQPARGRKIQSKIKDGQSGQYFMKQIYQVIRKGISCGEFHPVLSPDAILSFISIAIDGIAFDGSLLTCYEVPQVGEIPFQIVSLVDTLKSATLLMLCPESI